MKQIIFILTILTITFGAFATEQETDMLIVGTDTIYLYSFPLENLELSYRPYDHTWKSATSTACWRGYRAIWRLVNNKLYLEKIISCYSDRKYGEQNIKELFEKNGHEYQAMNELILADWLTMDFYTMSDSTDQLYLNDVFFGKVKNKEKSIILRIVNGVIIINRLDI